MSNDLLKISLTQGKEFNKYQKNIKKGVSRSTNKHLREGFVTSQQEMMVRPEHEGYVSVLKNQQPVTTLTNTTNQKDLDEFKDLQAKYSELMLQYTTIQTSIGDSSLSNIGRVSSNNPYLNKNIQFTDGTICYVTNQGIAKPYPSNDIYNSIVGKNGCPPKEYITLNISWSSQYVKGSKIPTNPPLIVGSNMVAGQSCGYEGDNIYVSEYLPNNITPSYMGCFNTSENNDNMTFLGEKPNLTTTFIQNSNFETPILSNNSFKYIKGNSEVPGWIFYGATLLNNSAAWGYTMPYPNGNQCVSIQNTASISQIINLSANMTYALQFMSCGRNCCSSPAKSNTIKVELYDIDNKLVSLIYEATPPINTWTSYSVSFNVSTTNNYTLKFSGTNVNGDNSSAIQNITLNSDNTTSAGNYTYDDCKNAAIANGYQFFALQNINTNTSKGFCAVNNSSPAISKYGEAFTPSKLIPLWSSNTSQLPGNTCTLNNTGSLSVMDSSGRTIFSTPASTDTDSGYLGCYGDSKSNRAMSNTSSGAYYSLDKCRDLAKEQGYAYYAGQNAKKDGSTWCSGSNDFVSSTKYGLAKNCINNNGTILGGFSSNAIYSVDSGGKFYVILNDDGNMCIHRGTDPNNDQGIVWCSDTKGKQQKANPNMTSSKGKYGKNWMANDSTMVMGDFIGSTKGDLVLMMQDDGNLVLYTYDMVSNCRKMNDGNMGGGINANAAYDLQKVAITKNLGLLAYVDSDSNLKQYPESMVGFTNDYQIYKNTYSAGNDILSITAANEEECQAGCNNNVDCAGYVYNPTVSTCWLKNRNQFKKQSNNSSILGIRNPKLKGSATCSNKIINVDTIQYENYVKGDEMTQDTECNASLVSQEDQIKFDNIKNELYLLGQDITSKMENLYNQDKKIYEKMNMNEEEFKKNLEKYKTINMKIRKEKNLQSNNNVEGMQNYIASKKIEGLRNMNDLNGMLSDTDLRVLQENYSYILWSILAVGLLTITINTMKK